MKKHTPFDDEDLNRFFLDPDPKQNAGMAALVNAYKALREHHVEETALLADKDRTLICNMAASIAGPVSAVTTPEKVIGLDWNDVVNAIVTSSVKLARAILAEVDKKAE